MQAAVSEVLEVVASRDNLTTLVSFNRANGGNPNAGLVLDSSGNLFGTTFSGGANHPGTLFEVTDYAVPKTYTP
jgi:hypothetical protein